ncbi:hypothetical protein GCM10023205_06690 [Yinghuangia aomiensis]|uniref:Integral membrane protein n=1 Tax=Yinghuangia aomiensis TaxID=676205 RepID=A0ABP9GNS5_9ACTN
MRIGRATSAFLLLFGIWTWFLWPNFLRNIWADDRSWNDGPTAFFLVHLALTAVSFAAGNAIGWIGLKGVRANRANRADGTAAPAPADGPAPSDAAAEARAGARG